MRLTEAIPIATAVVALAAVAAMGWERRRTGTTPVRPLLATVGLMAAAGWVSARSLEALSAATLATSAVMMAAALVVAAPQPTPPRSSADAAANTALWSGLLVVALLLVAWRSDTSVLVAAVPAIIGVLAVWLGAQALANPNASPALRSRAAIETVLAVALGLGAVACASIAAGCAVVRADPSATAAAFRTLGRATTFALPLALAAGIVLARRLADVGRGTPSRVQDLIATAAVLVLAGAALRFQLGRLVRPTPTPPVAVARPAPPAPPPAPAPLRATATADALEPAAPSTPDAAASGDPLARVVVGKPSVSGMLAPPEVERSVQKLGKLVEKCVDKASGAGRAGDIAVKFTIGPNGSVANVQDDPETSVGDTKLVGCVLASFYQIGFPRPTRGYVRVELPITIRAQ